MASADFIFHLTPYDTQKLLPQVSKALEKRTELLSRQRYPGLWKQTDRLNARAKGKSRGRLRTRVMSVLCLVLGIILFVPGMMEPQALFAPLVVGAFAVAAGVGGLWRSFRQPRNPFDKSAATLLSGLEALPADQLPTVSFSAQEMTVDGTQTTLWTEFTFAVESPDAWLLVYEERVILLQKKDLVQGNAQDLGAFLAQRIPSFATV